MATKKKATAKAPASKGKALDASPDVESKEAGGAAAVVVTPAAPPVVVAKPRDKRTPKGGRGKYKRAPRVTETGQPVKAAPVSSSADGYALAIMLVHDTLALRTPEMKLDKRECDALAKNFERVSQLYGYKPSPKVEAWFMLAGTVAVVYGPRMAAIQARKARAKPAATPPPGPPPRATAPPPPDAPPDAPNAPTAPAEAAAVDWDKVTSIARNAVPVQ